MELQRESDGETDIFRQLYHHRDGRKTDLETQADIGKGRHKGRQTYEQTDRQRGRRTDINFTMIHKEKQWCGKVGCSSITQPAKNSPCQSPSQSAKQQENQPVRDSVSP